MQKIEFTTQDNQVLQGFFYPALKAKGTVLLASALGVPQQFYKYYAQFLAESGYQCLTFDYRGTGLSTYQGNIRDVELSHWGTFDLEAAIQEATSRAVSVDAEQEVFLVGHSIGGQILGLAKSVNKLKAAVFVASSAPFWRRWSFPQILRIGFVCNFLLPVFSFSRDMYPARAVGLSSMDLPASCTRDWGRWMRNKDYLFGERFKLPVAGYKNFNKPLLSFAFDDDDFAPKVNVDYLLNFFKSAQITSEYISSDSLNLGAIDHMGFFKQKFSNSLWQKSLDWIDCQKQFKPEKTLEAQK